MHLSKFTRFVMKAIETSVLYYKIIVFTDNPSQHFITKEIGAIFAHKFNESDIKYQKYFHQSRVNVVTIYWQQR